MKNFNKTNMTMRRINLNLFRYAAMVAMLLMLGVSETWAHSNHTGKVTLVNATGNGTVYLSTASGSNSGQSSSSNPGTKNGTSVVTWSCGSSSSGDAKTLYPHGTGNAGYYYLGYATTSNATSGYSTDGKSFNASSDTDTKIYGYFAEITINNGTASPATIAAEDNSTTSTANTCAITYATKGDAQNDFKAPTVGSASGNGTFTATWNSIASDGKATVDVKFVGDGTYGGKNKAADNRSRTSSAVVTLTSAVGNNKGTCTVNASFPNIIVSAGEGADMYTTNGEPKSASATFPVQWADDADDFTATFSGATNGGAWTVDAISYTATDSKSGVITVDYTFDNQRAADAAGTVKHSAVLTLSANTNAGGASNTVTLNAESKKASSGDAVVVSGSDETEYETLADAIGAANSLNTNPTVRLLRNVDLETLASALEIKKPMTLDLASFEITATVSSSVNKLFYLNSATAALTINDSKNGGAITVTGSHTDFLYAVMVDKGALNITKGDITISNTNTGGTAKAAAVCVGSNGRLLMSGGNLTATTAGSYAYGVITTTVPSATESTVGITGGTITATAAKTMGIGIYCQSTSATASGDPTAANVVLSGVTVNASTEGTTDAYAIQVDAGVSLLINSGTYTATSNTQNAYALNTKGYVAVLNGTFNANATMLLARGIHLEGGITAVRNGGFTATATTEQAHAAYVMSGAKLLTYGGTFTGRLTGATSGAWATGTIVVSGGSLEAQGGTFFGNIAKSGLSAVQTNYAAGIYANTGSTVSLASATLRGQTADAYVNGAYGLYTKTANALGLTNCTLYGTSAHQKAYGIYNAGTPLAMNNARLEVNSTKEYSYGIYTDAAAASVEAKNSTVNSTSASTYAYGAYVANGTLNASNTTFDVTVSQTAAGNSYLRGLYVNTGKSAFLTDCKVTATGTAAYSNNGYGLYVDGSIDVENTEVTVSGINSGAYAIFNSANTGLINIASGKFKATATSTGVAINGTAAAEKQKLYGGYYTTNTNLSKYLADGCMVETLTAGDEFKAGYKYQVRPTVVLQNPVCKIGSIEYGTLEEALEYANKNASTSMTILMVADYTLPAGNYILPAKATLLVPKKDQTSLEEHPTRVSAGTAWAAPTYNRKLTFAENAHLVVLGKIQTGGVQAAVNQMPGHNGVPRDTYGHIVLNTGSTITLESGSHLYSWGYVTGAGTIDAKRGSTVHECLQIRDWRGGTCTSDMNGNSEKVFPLNQYFIQNIESAITFHPGSAEKCDGTVNARTSLFNSTPKAYTFDDVNLIGITNSGSLFMMDNEDNSADTWVRKYYDTTNDMQVYELNSSAYLGSLSLSLYGISFNSVSYVLPLTNNMHIHLLTGEMHVTQDTEVLPGAIIEVDKEATAYVDAGKSLYIFDADEWNQFGTSTSYFYLLAYSPTFGKAPTVRSEATKPADAALNIHGKFVINGAIYTTASGANIYSTDEDAGTVKFNVAASTAQKSVYVNNTTSGSSMTARPSNSAYLKNGDGTYEHTAGTASGKSWIYYDGKWNCWEEKNCFGYDKEDNPYAKPRAWVQLTSDVADPTTHLYADADTGNRRFLVEDDCTWWEVEPTPYDGNKYKCVDPDYDGRYKYYEYVNNKWQEAKVTITWKNGSTTIATYNNALYGVSPKYLEGTPSKAATTSEFYTWLGWTKDSETGEFFAKDAELPYAKKNTTYYAYFETTKFQYTITLKNYDESVLDAKRWNAGETPVYAYTPLKPSTTAKEYTFDGWATSKTGVKAYEITGLPVASAAATYYAHYVEADRNYTVQWVNYDGTVLKSEKVAYNTTPSAPATPTRPNDTYYTYTFDAWSPAITAVAGDQTYTATYTYEKKVPKYTATFKNGSETVYTQNLKSGEVPVFDGTTPTKAATAQYTYTFDGWSTTNGGALAYAPNAALPALTADVTYYAHFASTTNTYSVYWRSEDGKTLLHTDNNVAYGVAPAYDGTPTKPRVGTTQYVHDGWSASVGGAKIPSLPTISGDATYYAHFAAAYDVTFDANGHGTAPSAITNVEYNSTITAPTAPSETGYTFGGWYKEAGCTNAWNFASDVVTAATTLYAKWTIKTFTITWKDGSSTIKSESWNYGATPSFAYEKPETPQYTFELTGWDPAPAAVTADATYTAQYNAITRSYTITFVNDDNATVLQQDYVSYGVKPQYTGETPTSTKTDGIYQFTGWSPEITTVTGQTTYTAQYIQLTDLVVEEGETLPVTITAEVTTTTVHAAGQVNVAADKTLTTYDLILEATPSSSGEITGAGTVTVTNNAYFHFSQPGGFKAKTWYAVAVPWQVNVPAYELGDVYTKKGDGAFEQQTLGTTFDLIYYDGERRARGATKAWNYVEDDQLEQKHYVMEPGRAYMIYLTSDADVIRFKKNSETLLYTNVVVATYPQKNGLNGTYADWNGIANPAIYKAYLNVGATEGWGQVYNAETKQYEMFNMSSNQLQVGQPIFVQSTVSGTIVANAVSNEFTPASAPRRSNGSAETLTRFEVLFAASETDASDRIIVRMNEDKEEDKYIVGQDLAKMGVSLVVPQMWIDRYDSKMCINTAIPVNNKAVYPLSLFVPQAGEYMISIQEPEFSNQNDMLYLTYDNRIIWNLTYSPYTASLEKGTNTHYGLRIVHAETPAATTDMEGAVVDAHGETRKVLIKDKVFIIRGDQVYSVDGQMVK